MGEKVLCCVAVLGSYQHEYDKVLDFVIFYSKYTLCLVERFFSFLDVALYFEYEYVYIGGLSITFSSFFLMQTVV